MRQEFATRHEQNKEIARQEQDRKQAMKTHIQSQPARRAVDVGNKLYRWGEDPELSQTERDDANTVILAMKDFDVTGARATHGFFSTMPPEDMLAELVSKMTEGGQQFKVSDTHWKVNFEVKKQINQEPEEDEEEE